MALIAQKDTLARTLDTHELDQVLAAVFGLGDAVIPVEPLFAPDALAGACRASSELLYSTRPVSSSRR
jgi:hypothetical protein